MSGVAKPKPDPKEWPTFILDLGATPSKDRWTIRFFKDCEPDMYDPKIGWKYSAISYGWGYWHDKRKTTAWHDSTKEPAYPAFDPKVSTAVGRQWVFPTLNQNYKNPFSYQDPIDPIFTIENIRKVLTSLNTRYVWWDWACIPQGMFDDLKVQPIPAGTSFPSTIKTVNDLQTLEVNKMRTVYKCSVGGCLWLHQTTWVRDNKSIKGPVQELLEHVISIRSAGLSKLTIDSVEVFYGLLLAAVNTQQSLTSLWSFQEGILFGDPTRPQMTGSSTCAIIDHNGETFGKGLDGLNGGYGDYVTDMVALASQIFEKTTDVLDKKLTGTALDSGASPFEKWAYSEESKTRDLLSRLIATGFIGYFNNNPMSLFESKYTRSLKAGYMTETDRTVRAVIGGMNVDISEAKLLEAATANDTARKNALAQNPQPDEWTVNKAGDAAEAAVLKPAFVRVMIEGYQWRFLLHARGKESIPAAGSAAAPSWWSKFGELKRPPFASLEYYIGSTSLFDLYAPRQARPTTLPANTFDLPSIEISATKPELPLIIKAKSSYQYYNLTRQGSTGWFDKGQFYEYIKATPPSLPQNLEDIPGLPQQPGTVSASVLTYNAPSGWKPAKPGDLEPRKEKMGDNLLLFPFEKKPTLTGLALGIKSILAGKTVDLNNEYRCFVFSDYNAANKTVIYRGVGDFVGLDKNDLTSLTADLEVW